MLSKSSKWPWRLPQETGKQPPSPQVQQFALPAPGASSLRIRPPNPGPRPETALPGNLSGFINGWASPPGDTAGTPVQPQVLSHLGLSPGPRRPGVAGPRNVPDCAFFAHFADSRANSDSSMESFQSGQSCPTKWWIHQVFPVYWIKIRFLQQRCVHWECSNTAIRIMPNMGQWTLEKKFSMFCHLPIFERLHKFRSLNHLHLGEHIPAIQLLNMFHLFMPLQLEASRAFLIQERFRRAFYMTQTVCHFFCIRCTQNWRLQMGCPGTRPYFT